MQSYFSCYNLMSVFSSLVINKLHLGYICIIHSFNWLNYFPWLGGFELFFLYTVLAVETESPGAQFGLPRGLLISGQKYP